jgi:PadR family transcriptional regulator PadR
MKKRLELLKGSTDSLLLCLLNQQPMYGYQIIRELEARSQGYFRYKEGTLYPALHRLEKSGLLKAEWYTETGGRPRRYYHLTKKGQAILVEQRTQWLNFFEAMNTIIRPASV